MNHCVDCLFLAKITIRVGGKWEYKKFPLSRRGELESGPNVGCYRKVWNSKDILKESTEPYGQDGHRLIAKIAEMDQKNTCGFYKYEEGITFPGGIELSRIESENKQQKTKSIVNYSTVSIAALSLMVSIVALLKSFDIIR